jgi:peptide/nickel transport system permease protein
MMRYVIRRLLQAIPLLLIISLILFILVSNLGDPLAAFGGVRRRLPPEDRARLTRRLGLDQPVPVQYLIWLIGNDWMKIDVDGDGVADESGTREGVLRGDFGTSFTERRPAIEIIKERILNTLLLMGASEVVVIVFALVIGIYSATRQYSVVDSVITTLSFIGYSMPIFWLALMLIYIFSINFRRWGLPYFPVVGMYDLEVGRTFGQVVWHMVLPVASLSIVSVAGYSRYVRSQMLEVINQDYIRTARAKGLPKRMILFGHALKNAALPLVTIIGMDLPLLLGGSVVTEAIFAWPGMGRLYFRATNQADIPVIMGILVIISALVVIFQLITDVVYTFLDPRIRYD